MNTNNGESNAPSTSSDISDSVKRPDLQPSNKLNTSNSPLSSPSSSSSSCSSSNEANNHDKGTAKQAPLSAGESTADTAPDIAVVTPTPLPTEKSTDKRKDTLSPADSKHKMRPKLGSRRSSGTIIIPRDSQVVEVDAEVYDEGDARAMSPPRTTEEVDKMTEEARATLTEQAKTLQSSIGDLVDRVETVKSEHDKLETGNKFLQSYIGQLMHSTKITASGAGRSSKGKNRVS